MTHRRVLARTHARSKREREEEENYNIEEEDDEEYYGAVSEKLVSMLLCFVLLFVELTGSE